MAEPREAPFGHEPPGVATRRVVGVVVGMGVLIAVALVAIYLALTYWIMPNYGQLHTQRGVVPPAPRLQPHPDHDLTALREEKKALLHGYMWTDKSHRFARIPIERAMQIDVQERATASRKSGLGTRDSGLGNEASGRKPGPGTGNREPDGNTRGPAAGLPAASASSGRQP